MKGHSNSQNLMEVKWKEYLRIKRKLPIYFEGEMLVIQDFVDQIEYINDTTFDIIRQCQGFG